MKGERVNEIKIIKQKNKTTIKINGIEIPYIKDFSYTENEGPFIKLNMELSIPKDKIIFLTDF